MTLSTRAADTIATPTPSGVAALAINLRRTSERLRARSAREVVASLGAAGRRFLDPGDAVRSEALERLPESSGLSPETCQATLDAMAADWTEDRLLRLLAVELGDPSTLDRLVERDGRTALAIGPALCVQIAAGGVPGVGVTALVRSLLVKAPTLLKAGRGDTLLPSLYARALQDVDSTLAESLAVVYWPVESTGQGTLHLDAALVPADVVVAYGSDEAVETVRERVPVTTRFVAYHHRVSVGLVGRDALTAEAVDATAGDVAAAVGAYDQRGCVSPQVVYVEEGGACTPRAFAARLATALAAAERRWPSGTLDLPRASDLQQARGTAEMVAAAEGGDVHHGGSDAWTVVFETGGGSATRVAGRFVRVRPLPDASELPRAVAPFGGHLQTVGIAGFDGRPRGQLDALTAALGEAGASRVAPFRSVPFPPPWWHHDGRGPLLDLVRWVDLERPTP